MKIAVIYNRDSKRVINLFGQPNLERYGLKTIDRILKALRDGGHQPRAFEGDKDLIQKLEEFMPRVLRGERPGMAFNVSYGVQGQARYTHVPSILEMVGIPYVGSGPLAHSIALDKVVTKMLLVQHQLPTPEFAVLDGPDQEVPEIAYPVIVKPKHEAVSFGIRVCQNAEELAEAAGVIFKKFGQAVLVERFIEGREINVGLLGNGTPEALPPVELVFPSDGPTVYSYEDKTHRSGRTIEPVCPAPIGKELTERAQTLAQEVFKAVGCYDCARVDMRLDEQGNLYVLELNSLPSLGAGGSFVRAAAEVGLDFSGLVNRLVEVASVRYFGTPEPPVVSQRSRDPSKAVFAFITQRRDTMEARLARWVTLSSRSDDPVGLQHATEEAREMLSSVAMQEVEGFADTKALTVRATRPTAEGAVLLVAHLDVPAGSSLPAGRFRRAPEVIHGEGVGSSRAPLVQLEFALRALRQVRQLLKRHIAVALYCDEGRDAVYSAEALSRLMGQARRVLVLRPAGPTNKAIVIRRGQRRLRLTVEGKPLRPGQARRQREAMMWLAGRMPELVALSSRDRRVSVSIGRLETNAYPMLLPHRVTGEIVLTYGDPAVADEIELKAREILGGTKNGASLTTISDRPPLRERKRNKTLANAVQRVAKHWEIPFATESSVWPSVAGLCPARTPVLCGMGPSATGLYTPDESVSRISLIERTLLLAEFLLEQEEQSS